MNFLWNIIRCSLLFKGPLLCFHCQYHRNISVEGNTPISSVTLQIYVNFLTNNVNKIHYAIAVLSNITKLAVLFTSYEPKKKRRSHCLPDDIRYKIQKEIAYTVAGNKTTTMQPKYNLTPK